MKSSLIVIGFFIGGCALGYLLSYLQTDDFTFIRFLLSGDIAKYVLYLLMFQVGISIGSDKNMNNISKSIKLKMLLVPLATILGTLVFSSLAVIFLQKRSLTDILAISSGFAYYSLSSILITDIKSSLVGIKEAAELGIIALIANLIREIIALLCAPMFCRFFGKLAPICAAGATSMDTTLPIITQCCGKNLVFIAILNGVLVDFSVPFLVTFFASI